MVEGFQTWERCGRPCSFKGTKMRTPRMSIEDIMMDWAEGGVKMYDEIAPNDLDGLSRYVSG